MKRLFQKTNVLSILTYFLDNPYTEIYLRELARKTGKSPSTVLRVLSLLEKDGLIIKRVEKNATFFKASMSPGFKALKITYAVGKLEDAQFIDSIKAKSKGLSSILLYGSAAKGEDDVKSDYDIIAIASECTVTSHELSKVLRREVNFKSYAISEWKEISKQNRAFYLEVISNSFVLYGQKPVID